jgi:hypothetical protein
MPPTSRGTAMLKILVVDDERDLADVASALFYVFTPKPYRIETVIKLFACDGWSDVVKRSKCYYRYRGASRGLTLSGWATIIMETFKAHAAPPCPIHAPTASSAPT